MELVYLSQADVEGLGMSMREVLDALDLGFAAKGRGNTEMPPKPGIHTRPDCFIHAMPAYVQELEVAGLKWVSGYPPNPAKGLPYITGLLVLNDCETGVPLAVMDCAWITAMRTGASAGISAKYLARAGSDVRRHRRLRRAGAHQPHGAGRGAAGARRGALLRPLPGGHAALHRRHGGARSRRCAS